MLHLAKQPKWIALAVLVAAITSLFVSLGFWQLDRRAERILENTVRTERLSSPPQRIEDMTAGVAGDVSSLDYRMVIATGVFHPEDEILIRNRVYQSVAGFDVVTPLVTDAGLTVLVDRGWVPLELDKAPVSQVPPPKGRVDVVALGRVSQDPGSFGIRDDAFSPSFARIDLALFATRFPNLAPIWLQEVSSTPPGSLPATPPMPSFTSEGPHLSYAIQWFSFALISVVGFALLARKSAPL